MLVIFLLHKTRILFFLNIVICADMLCYDTFYCDTLCCIFFSKPNQFFTEIIVYMCFTISSFYGGLIKSINQSIKQHIMLQHCATHYAPTLCNTLCCSTLWHTNLLIRDQQGSVSFRWFHIA